MLNPALWENVYLYNGTFYIITSSPELLPPVGHILGDRPDTSRSLRPAKEDRWMVVGMEEAKFVLGTMAMRKGGTTVSGLSLSNLSDSITVPETLFGQAAGVT
jgi:hypothetical protein